MTDEPVERPPIAPPRTKHPDDRARVPLEAALSLVPGGSAITKLVGEFVPTQAQKSRGKWEVAVSERPGAQSDNHAHGRGGGVSRGVSAGAGRWDERARPDVG